jgi:capsular polysaccharide biosynthesis protein
MSVKYEIFNPQISHIPMQLASTNRQFRNYIDACYKWNYNYYHFITEALPSILFLNKQIAHYPVLCPPSAFCRALFHFMDIDNEIMHKIPSTVDIRFKQLYVECGNPSPEKIALLRDVICPKVTFEPSIGIFLLRKESIRSIINHDETLDMLKIVFSDMEWRVFVAESIPDTVDLFRKAKLIVAPHGAGLTNMLFSAKGTPIIEFMPVDSPNICYWHLAELLENPYHMIGCNTLNKQMIVDIEETTKILQDLHL